MDKPKMLLYSEEKIWTRALNAESRHFKFLHLSTDITIQLLRTIQAERFIVEELVALVKRNSHKDCYCKACVDARDTLYKLSLDDATRHGGGG